MSNMISLSEALDLICQRTGMTRRQAKRSMLKKLRNDELRAFGTSVHDVHGQMVTSGRLEEMDPEFWRADIIEAEDK